MHRNDVALYHVYIIASAKVNASPRAYNLFLILFIFLPINTDAMNVSGSSSRPRIPTGNLKARGPRRIICANKILTR